MSAKLLAEIARAKLHFFADNQEKKHEKQSL